MTQFNKPVDHFCRIVVFIFLFKRSNEAQDVNKIKKTAKKNFLKIP